jgi:hypothetical protein
LIFPIVCGQDSTKEAARDRVAAPVKTSASRQQKSKRQKTTREEEEMGKEIPEEWPVRTGDRVLVRWSMFQRNSTEEEYHMATVCSYPICYHLLVYLLSKKYR